MPIQGYRHGTRMRTGVTLLELLVVLALTAILASAVSYAMMAVVNFQHLSEQRRAAVDRTSAMQREIQRLLTGSKFTAPSTTAGATTTTTTTVTSPTAVGTTTYFQGVNDGNSTLAGSDRLTFTTTAPGVPLSSVHSLDDYQTQQNEFGPVGGVSEVSIGLQPVGQAPAGQTGLFERVQTPSDTDPTQGGQEWLLDADVAEIGFEFWDGQQWQPAWDTTNGQTQLPQMVRVSYTIRNEQGNPTHSFTVPIPASTVNAQNPATTSTTTTATGGATP